MKKKILLTILRIMMLGYTCMICWPVSALASGDSYFNAKSNNSNSSPADASPRLWNLQSVDIQQVAAEVSRETGKNFLIDPRVSGKISIISSTPLSGDEVYQMFLSMLQVLGYTVIPTGPNVYKIIPLSGSVSQNIPIASSNQPGQGAEMVVRIIPVYNVSASKLVPILRPLIPDTGGISAYFPANALMITSSASNINHLLKVITALDKADTTRIEVINLHNSTASEVVSILNSMEPDTSDELHVTLAADDHTNSILLSGDMQGRMKMRALIARLDLPPPPGFEGNTQVIYLHYLKAAKIAPVLTKVAQADSASMAGGNKDSAKLVNIQAEATTNSLILTAPPAIMHNLQSVITQLDVRPAQVLVEAAIVEIDEGTLKQLGVQWGTINNESSSIDAAGISSSVSSDSTSVDTSGGSGSSITRGSLPTGYNQGVGVIKSGNFREIITALQQSQSTDILSTPSLVVLDNQTAKIDVGKTLSIQTGSYANTDNTSSVTPFDTYDRQQIGLHLYVTPQINRGDAVQLKIDQGNETLENPLNPGTTPVTNNSGIKTTVLVNSGDVLVLGGLISDNQQAGETKIPLVGDIPGIGKLFQYHTNTNVKKNLMVFLKPIILYNKDNNVYITNGKYNFMRNQEIRWNNKQAIQSTNTLPPSSTQVTLPAPFSGPGMINPPPPPISN